MSAVDPRWYEDFFGDDWLAIARTVTNPERTVRQVDFVVDRLALEPGARILDLACGHGRHADFVERRALRAPELAPRLHAAGAPHDARWAGLEVEAAWSDWDGHEYGFEGSRLIVHARRRG